MKTKALLMLNALGAGIAIAAGWMAVDAGEFTPTASALLTASICFSLTSVVGLFVVEPEVWP